MDQIRSLLSTCNKQFYWLTIVRKAIVADRTIQGDYSPEHQIP